jgi:hypothetical protein
MIDPNAFTNFTGSSERLVQVNSHIREIHGFSDRTLLNRIKIPASVEVIEAFGFCRCWTVDEFACFVTARMMEIDWFGQWQSRSRMAMFRGRASNHKLIFPSRTQIRAVWNARVLQAFVIYLDNDAVKQNRRRIQASIQQCKIGNREDMDEFGLFMSICCESCFM